MKKCAILVFIFLSILSLTVGCGTNSQQGGTEPSVQPKPTQVLVEKSQSLVNSIIAVNPVDYYDFAFNVDADKMQGARIVGSFTAKVVGGTGSIVSASDIIVLIMDDAAFNTWKNHQQVSTLYNSGKVATGTIDLAIATPGRYHIIFDNTYSTSSPKDAKDVTTKVTLKWSE
jgi:hypothetical protein